MRAKYIKILGAVVFVASTVYFLLYKTLKYTPNSPTTAHQDSDRNNPSHSEKYPLPPNGNNSTHNHQHRSGNNPNVMTQTLSSFINKVEITPSMSRPVNCPTMKPKFMLCLHEPLDLWSKILLKKRLHERDTTTALNKMLTAYPTASFIDFGSNIGYFSHLAMARGRKVIAVEPLARNVRLLLWAARINERETQLTMLLNAVSDTHTELVLSTPSVRNKHAWDMTFVGEMSDVTDNSWTRDRNKTLFQNLVKSSAVKTIMMNDVISMITTPDAVMKIDVEGHECNAFHPPSSLLLFSRVFIPYVIMEWRFHEHGSRIPSACTPEGVVILTDYLTALGYQPYVYSLNQNRLKAVDIRKDIMVNVIWVHKNAKDFLSTKEI